MRHSTTSDGRARPAFRRPLQAIVLLFAVVVGALTWSAPAQAHGSVVDPASRAYRCWNVWGSHFQDPAMQTEDPMCWQAWQANTNTMWNWMSSLRNGLAGQFQAQTPDGKLCSNNLAENDALNKAGPWKATDIGSNFSVHVHDQASHGADYFKAYVSKQGYNPETQTLGWGNLDYITQTGRYAPATDYTFNLSTSGYTGHHVLFVIWQASHMDQTYMWCSDVNFG
jgi:lytic cellulose monooxygenase (C4-dehydrogenating)